MRIGIYTETALPIQGGQELSIDACARQFQMQGHRPVVLTLRLRRRQAADDSPFPYPVVRHRRYLSTRFFLGWYRRSLEALRHHHAIDVLHCHNIYPAGFVAADWCARRQVPLILTSHACDIAPDSHLLRKPGVLDRMRSVIARANAIIAISPQVEARFRELGAVDGQLHRIGNGVDTRQLGTQVAPESLPIQRVPTSDYFLFLGRLVKRKGVDLLLRAFRRIASLNPTDLVIAGDGEEAAALLQLSHELGLARRVHFLGAFEGQEKLCLLQRSRCMVVPSRISEGSSLVLMESFAAARPVIASAIPGLAEMVQHRATGMLVRENDEAELADAMLFVARNPAVIDAWGQTAKRYVADFDWSRIAGRHLSVYEAAQSHFEQRLHRTSRNQISSQPHRRVA